MLAYNGEHFMQLLEGQDAAVDELLARIVADPRHRDLVVIRRDERLARECPYWSMRAFLTPLAGAGSATRFAAGLPVSFAADTAIDRVDVTALVGRILHIVSADDWALIVATKVQGRQNKELAAERGVDPSCISKRINAAIRQIRESGLGF